MVDTAVSPPTTQQASNTDRKPEHHHPMLEQARICQLSCSLACPPQARPTTTADDCMPSRPRTDRKLNFGRFYCPPIDE
ncbi:hypothetical protein RRG08_023470 [Elysia crispata]|uniref:Uncharacterized protein n=1 Tax=Elysia crispata TaxID=231223 RepID=A0AAE1ADR3_9GAST|nr:hypothetical protein RRG08_023470 [Elysia crispata]